MEELLEQTQFANKTEDLLYGLCINVTHSSAEYKRQSKTYGLAVLSSFKYIYSFKTPITFCLLSIINDKTSLDTMRNLYKAMNSLDLEHLTIAPQVEIKINKWLTEKLSEYTKPPLIVQFELCDKLHSIELELLEHGDIVPSCLKPVLLVFKEQISLLYDAILNEKRVKST